MFSKTFWKDTTERAIATAAQAVLIVTGLSEDAIGVIDQSITWEMVLWAAGAGAALAFLKALAAVGLNKTASMAKVEYKNEK